MLVIVVIWLIVRWALIRIDFKRKTTAWTRHVRAAHRGPLVGLGQFIGVVLQLVHATVAELLDGLEPQVLVPLLVVVVITVLHALHDGTGNLYQDILIVAGHIFVTVDDVIFQNGQFSSLRRLKNINPTELELRIAYNVLNGSLRVLNDKDVMYFRNPKITSGISASTKKDWGNLEYATYIGEHAFYSQESSEDAKKESIFDKLPSSLDISKLFTHKPNTSVAKSEEPVEYNITDTSEVEPSTNTNTECNLVETVAVAETATVDEIATVDDTVADNIAENIEPVLIETAAVDDTVTLDETAAVAENAAADETVADNMEPALICENTIAEKETAVISEDPLDKEIEEFLKTYDANDPVSAARYQALLDQKAERERLLRLQEEERIANEKARQQAVLLDKMAVEKVQRENEEYLRATNAAISQVLLIQGQ